MCRRNLDCLAAAGGAEVEIESERRQRRVDGGRSRRSVDARPGQLRQGDRELDRGRHRLRRDDVCLRIRRGFARRAEPRTPDRDCGLSGRSGDLHRRRGSRRVLVAGRDGGCAAGGLHDNRRRRCRLGARGRCIESRCSCRSRFRASLHSRIGCRGRRGRGDRREQRQRIDVALLIRRQSNAEVHVRLRQVDGAARSDSADDRALSD